MVHRMTVYVGNLPYDACKDDISDLFVKFGAVKSVMIPTDRENNNRPRGFCFVELEDDESEDTAIRELNQPDALGRSLCVIGGRTTIITKAKPREETRGRSASASGPRTGGRPFGNRDNRSRSASAGGYGNSSSSSSSNRESGSREYSTRGSFRNSDRKEG